MPNPALNCPGSKATVFLRRDGQVWASPNYHLHPVDLIQYKPSEPRPRNVDDRGLRLRWPAPARHPISFNPRSEWRAWTVTNFWLYHQNESKYHDLLDSSCPSQYVHYDRLKGAYVITPVARALLNEAHDVLWAAVVANKERIPLRPGSKPFDAPLRYKFDVDRHCDIEPDLWGYIETIMFYFRELLGFCHWAVTIHPSSRERELYPRHLFLPDYPRPHWADKLGCVLDLDWFEDAALATQWINHFSKHKVPFCFNKADPRFARHFPSLFDVIYDDITREGFKAARQARHEERVATGRVQSNFRNKKATYFREEKGRLIKLSKNEARDMQDYGCDHYYWGPPENNNIVLRETRAQPGDADYDPYLDGEYTRSSSKRPISPNAQSSPPKRSTLALSIEEPAQVHSPSPPSTSTSTALFSSSNLSSPNQFSLSKSSVSSPSLSNPVPTSHLHAVTAAPTLRDSAPAPVVRLPSPRTTTEPVVSVTPVVKLPPSARPESSHASNNTTDSASSVERVHETVSVSSAPSASLPVVSKPLPAPPPPISVEVAEAIEAMKAPIAPIAFKAAPALTYRLSPLEWNSNPSFKNPVLISVRLSQTDPAPPPAPIIDQELGVVTSFWNVDILQDAILGHPWLNPSLAPDRIQLMVSTVSLRLFIENCGPSMTKAEAARWLRERHIPFSVLFHADTLTAITTETVLEAPDYLADDYELPFACIRYPRTTLLHEIHVPHGHFPRWVESARELTHRFHSVRFLDIGGMISRVAVWLNPSLSTTDPLQPSLAAVAFQHLSRENGSEFFRDYVAADEAMFLEGTVFTCLADRRYGATYAVPISLPPPFFFEAPYGLDIGRPLGRPGSPVASPTASQARLLSSLPSGGTSCEVAVYFA
ncbi:hypothetical protein SISSUDRAFT_1067857 [Sistotremastrum suecicum HHB10207 ss-3]|uniref:Uncharacterized protein n=1 Tax=Sistotremastrum suecicum HHB10207 ss-3 TaxID=1314776 RepID=A0A165WM56_9AGAM|nr:hypothetical protein SISSUDRAFT_1067857 [Sistotremastrum suecicum HHB10207 ss-3]